MALSSNEDSAALHIPELGDSQHMCVRVCPSTSRPEEVRRGSHARRAAAGAAASLLKRTPVNATRVQINLLLVLVVCVIITHRRARYSPLVQ